MPRERAIKLLHYKWISYPHLLAKHKYRMKNLSDDAIKLRLSGCEADADKMQAHFEEITANAFDVLSSKIPPYHSKLRDKVVDFLFYYLRGGRRRWVGD
ncbi:MAG: hypothetical protein D3921_01275 [Candidatus Electrothrix sp. AW1]|nr:hypothetical protein [Candidatus Electrothrix sp. AX1]MCI5181162.1 hypothetical protein [Candidatus Electrothrix gigas]